MLNVPFLCKNVNLRQTLITFLDNCKSMSELKQIHALLITFGVSKDSVSRILSFSALSVSGRIDYAYLVLSNLSNPTIFSWNAVIRGYSISKTPNKSFIVFVQMLRIGVSPDHLTYPFLAKASSRLLNRELGVAVHGHVLKTGYESDRFIANSFVHMYGSFADAVCARKLFDKMPTKNLVSWNSMLDCYAKCGDINSARKVFELMPDRDVVSWSSLIDGYVKSEEYEEAMKVFELMKISGPKANEVTMVSVLCACCHFGALEQGKMMHRYIIDNKLKLTLVLCTSLVDMYAKCGAIEDAKAVFHSIPVAQSDVLLWNAMIGGLATHGLIKESLELYEEMQVVGVTADEITYLCLFSACAHGGLVKEAWDIFNYLGKHGAIPTSEHYACMVDVLARAGQVAEAYKFLCEMPVEPTASLLGALLSGSINHGKFDIAEIVGRKLIELEPDHDGRYIGLSNVYAIIRRWDDSRTMREAMERRGVKKLPGYSAVEISGTLHRFIAHDRTHPSSEQVYKMLSLIVSEMKLDVEDNNQDDCLFDMQVFPPAVK